MSAQPYIYPHARSGKPVLLLRDGRVHWLTFFERVMFVIGWTNAYRLEAKWWDRA